MEPARDEVLTRDDEHLMALCRCECCRGTGPGGQHRNKTDSAVRLVFLPRPEIVATAVEERSQHVNRRVALKRLRLQLALHWRAAAATPWAGEWKMNPDNPQYPRLVAVLLDALHHHGYAVAEAARFLGLSTGQLVRLLAREPHVWTEVNRQRQQLGLKPLTQ